jgi:hydrogenase maturation protease
MAANDILVIGVGNEFRSDDGLGIHIVRELRRRVSTNVRLVEQSGEGTSLMETWKGVPHVFIVDAVVSNGNPGALHRVDVRRDGLPRHLFRSSSHTFGVAEAVALSRQLGTLPATLILYGIEIESAEPGSGLSAPVVCAVPDLLHALQHDIELLMPGGIIAEPFTDQGGVSSR